METIYGLLGGRKMTLGVIAVIGMIVLAAMGKIPVEEAVKWITALVAATSGAIALEDGLAQVGSKQKQHTAGK